MRSLFLLLLSLFWMPVMAAAQSGNVIPGMLNGASGIPADDVDLVRGGVTSFDSSYGLSSDPFDGGRWTSAARGEAWVMNVLRYPVALRRIRIEMAGTDRSSDGSYIAVQILQMDNQWRTVYELAGVVVNRKFSDWRAPVRKTGPQIIDLPDVSARAVRLYMKGTEGFSARDIQLYSAKAAL